MEVPAVNLTVSDSTVSRVGEVFQLSLCSIHLSYGTRCYLQCYITDPPGNFKITSPTDGDVAAVFEIKETDNLELTCQAQDANPDMITYIWKKEDDTFTVNSADLHINNIQRGDNEAKFACTATNTMTRTGRGDQTGTETRTVTLSVICK